MSKHVQSLWRRWDEAPSINQSLYALYFSPTAMIPNPIQNLRLTMDRDKPSLTLNWDPPSNVDFHNPDELTRYDIFFKPEGQQECTWMTAPRLSTTVTLTRKSGLVLDPVCQFSVRAQNCDQQAGEWITVTQLIGTVDTYLILHLEAFPW